MEAEVLWRQFGATIDMLEDSITACPDDLWTARLWRDASGEVEYSQVWNVVSHTLFWLELYLHGSEEGFDPSPPVGLEELDERGPLPPREYSKEELLAYLRHCRKQCRDIVEAMPVEVAQAIHQFPWGQKSFFELQIYNMRHVQEHASQISLLLGRERGIHTRWVGTART